MRDIKERYEGLIVDYKEGEKKVVKLLAEKEVAEKEIARLEAQVKTLIKTSPDKLDVTIEKLKKGIESELESLSDKVEELEGKISEMKVDEVCEEEQTTLGEDQDLLEDLDEI